MPWISVAVVAVLALFAAGGWRTGLVRRLLEIAGLFAALLIAAAQWRAAGDWLQRVAGVGERLAPLAGWLLIFAGVLIVSRLLAWLVGRSLNTSALGRLDRAGGLLGGLFAGLLVVSVALMLVCRLDRGGAWCARIQSQTVARLAYGAAPAIYSTVVDEREAGDLWRHARDAAADLPAAAMEAGRSAVDAGKSAIGVGESDAGRSGADTTRTALPQAGK
jgi:hypothetical protein